MQEVPVNVFWDIEVSASATNGMNEANSYHYAQNCAVPASMKGVQVVNAIRSFALQRGILKNISAFANLKLIKVCVCFSLSQSYHLYANTRKKQDA